MCKYLGCDWEGYEVWSGECLIEKVEYWFCNVVGWHVLSGGGPRCQFRYPSRVENDIKSELSARSMSELRDRLLGRVTFSALTQYRPVSIFGNRLLTITFRISLSLRTQIHYYLSFQ